MNWITKKNLLAVLDLIDGKKTVTEWDNRYRITIDLDNGNEIRIEGYGSAGGFYCKYEFAERVNYILIGWRRDANRPLLRSIEALLEN